MRSSIDENGVDVIKGSYSTSLDALSIGPDAPKGLTFSIRSFNGGWINGVRSQITLDGSNYVVTVDGSSDRFSSSGGVYTSTEGNGGTLTYNSSTTTYTYTRRDGTVALFILNGTSQGGPYPGSEFARATTITYPDGARVAHTYKISAVCVGTGPVGGCNGTVYVANRLQTVNTNTGYQLKFYYTDNILNGGNFNGWSNPITVKALNNTVDVCNGVVDTCTLTTSWPTANIAYTTVAAGRKMTVTDDLSRSASFTIDSQNNLLGVKRYGASADNVVVTYASNRVSAITDNGVSHTYTYSDSGSLRTTIVTDAQGAQRVYVGDTVIQRLKSYRDELLRITTYDYDANGRLTLVTYPEGNKVQIDYDTRGNVVSQRAISKVPGTPADLVVSAQYDLTCSNAKTCNQPNWTKDAKGNQTDYTYDGTHGGLLAATAPAPVVAGVRPETRVAYSALQGYYKTTSAGSIVASGSPIYLPVQTSKCQTSASCSGTSDEVRQTVDFGPQVAGTANNLLPVSVSVGSGNGTLTATNSFTYDLVGNRLTMDGPLSGAADTTRTRYDVVRRVVGAIGPDPDGAGALVLRAQRYSYNADNQMTLAELGTVTDQSDGAWSAFSSQQQIATTYDSNTRLVKQESKAGGTTYTLSQTNYDTLGQVSCVAQRMDPAQWSTQTDACVPQTTGANGPDRVGKTTYDAAGQITKVQLAFGTTAQSDEATNSYTANGKTQTVTDGEGNKTTFEYDGFDRLLKTRFPVPTVDSGTSSTTDFEQLGYDVNSNVISRVLRDGQTIGYSYDLLNRVKLKDLPSPESDASFTYDLLGRTLTAGQNSQTLTSSYDALSRLTSMVGPFGTNTYGYDIAGRRTSFAYPGGALTVGYDYDVTGNVTAIRENGAVSGVGVLATYAYDSLGRRISTTRGNGTKTSYSFDPISRLSSLTQDLSGTTNDLTIGSIGYIPSNQMLSQQRSNDFYAWSGHYNIDRPYGTNGLNQLTTSGSTSLGYDSRGNLTTSGSSSYGYSSENLLKTGPGSVTLDYDPAMRLYQTVGGGVTTRFSYDGPDLISEYDGSNTLLRRYVHGPGDDEPVVWYEGSSLTDRRWLHGDERGSVLAVSDSSGASLGINRYDEYGIPSSTNLGRFGYTGQTWLPELGLNYFKARIYSPTLGRFMQTDPIGYDDGINWYNYVGSDPINLTDPSGLCSAPYYIDCTFPVTGKQYHFGGVQLSGPVVRRGGRDMGIPNVRPPERIVPQKDLRRPDNCSGASFSVFESAANAAYAENPFRPYHMIFPMSALRGISIHSAFAGSLNLTGGLYSAEVSYKNGAVVPYGTSGSVRADGVYGPVGSPSYVVELKSGLAVPTPSEIDAYRRNLPGGTKVCAIVEAPGAP